MRREVSVVAAAGLLASCVALPEDLGIPISAGETIVGQLTEDDHRANDGSAVDVYVVELEASETITILVRRGFSRDYSSGFLDPYVYVFDEDRHQLAEDDDSGDGFDARLVFTAPRTGRYGIVVTTYETRLHRGQYTLVLLDGAHPDAI